MNTKTNKTTTINELENRSITIMDSIKIIFDRKIGDEQMHFAIGEARAHLIHLDVTGQAKSEIDDRGTVHYMKKWYSDS